MNGEPIRVLMVEDDADQAELVRRTLLRQEPPFDVTVVGDGFVCLEALAARPYSVVLLDYSLPRMNGLEVLRGIRSRQMTVPVVMVTGQGDERVAVEAMKAGATDYLVKTAGCLKALPSVLHKALKQHALAVENARLAQEVQRRLRETEGLLAVTHTLGSSLDPQEIAHRTARAVAHLLGADTALVLRPEERGGACRVVAGCEVPEALGALGGEIPIADLPPFASGGADTAASLAGASADSREAWGAHPVIRGLPAPPRAFLYAPVLSKGRVLGALVTYWWREPRGISEEDLRLAAGVASQMALALDNARLYEEAQQALADLKAAQEHMVRGATLRALGELASGAAHHLNNLLTVVLGRLELVRPTLESAGLRRHFQLMERAVSDATEVVRRVQRFARTRADEPRTPVDLNQVASDVLEMTRHHWQDALQAQGISIEVGLEPQVVPRVMGNATALREAVTNLVLNAVDALPKGGRITIRTFHAEGWVGLAVADTGVGMSEEVRRRAVEPFFTTKGPRSTGLGLSVTYGIAKEHGGELAIESSEGRGTTVTLRLPVTPLPDPASQRGGAAPGHATSSSRRLLLIDDDDGVREVLTEILTTQGHAVIQASGGREGLARLEAGEAVDLVLTDLGMPEMTGWEVARAIKSRWPHLPVALITGWGEELDVLPPERAMITRLLSKPVTPQVLQELIAACSPDQGARVPTAV